MIPWGVRAFVLVSLVSLGCGTGEDSEGPTGDADADTDADGDGTAAGLCVDTINGYRDTLALAHLSRWTDAESCSDLEARSDSETGVPHGAFGTCGESAQNECPGWGGPPEAMIESCLAMMWAEGPGEPFSEHGHYLNMSNAGFTTVACGYYTTPEGAVWAVQNFR